MATTPVAATPLPKRRSSEVALQPQLSDLSPRAAAALIRQHFDPRDVREFLRSSPARLIALAVLLMAICVAAGIVASSTVGDRSSRLTTLLADDEPFAASSQRLYSSLSIADAAATTAFISGGLEPQAVRNRYLQAMGDAAAEIAGGAAGTEDANTPIRQLVTSIATQLPMYAGLIETARTNNRSGHPVGAAYLGEASNLMHSRILPMAQSLHDRQTQRVATIEQRYSEPPWAAIALLVCALLALVLAQVYVARRWHRIFNLGLVGATVAIVALFAWFAIAGSISSVASQHALDHGTHPLENLTTARILGQQARSAETLKLARRDTTGQYDRDFDSETTDLAALLKSYPHDSPGADQIADAQQALQRWRQSHQRMNDTLDVGDFVGAAIVATGPESTGSMAQFDALDNDLGTAIVALRNDLRRNISRAAESLRELAPGGLGLGLVAGCLAAVGIWPRLREYR
ncbi:hypothetical protein FOS14_11355 [Skermania sp. ID1734]|uniref:hypothetical protein n=1 Tax=Skermania sp. ID1734 TaxID=2597516 RepID=UPI00117E0298|nr:hypothetical protein [Skermania sp. ID1734]TSD99386.1 hypothetical protein FOS14_11355 [Skermania sp. ID1734]